MIHKGRLCLAICLISTLFSLEAKAERRAIVVIESSTSGKLVRLSLGSKAGLTLGAPVLFSAGDKKIAAGRVIRVEEGTAVVAVLEKYGSETPSVDVDYELLYGEPFPEAANLPNYVADREDETDNPANEKFLQPLSAETGPELDDDSYTPETTIRPKFPLPKTFNAHNITVGLEMFRNRALAGADDVVTQLPQSSYTTYNGYTIRYAYSFRTNYWFKQQTPALISVEVSFGMYNFENTFPASIQPNPNDSVAQVRVIPLGLSFRYLVELSRLFRMYPYVGYQYNIVSAVNGSLVGLEPLEGSRLTGGIGGVLVMSDTIDARLEGGTDGFMGGLVVKF